MWLWCLNVIYGKVGSKLALSTVEKYAYVPFGYSGVIVNLPLNSSKSPLSS